MGSSLKNVIDDYLLTLTLQTEIADRTDVVHASKTKVFMI